MPTALTVHTSASTLALPVRPPQPGDEALRSFDAPEAAPGLETSALRPAQFTRTTERDLPGRTVTHRVVSEGDAFDGAVTHVEGIGLDVGYRIEQALRATEGDPRSAAATIE